jgi:membrane protease YdiL (CAAX protease family)
MAIDPSEFPPPLPIESVPAVIPVEDAVEPVPTALPVRPGVGIGFWLTIATLGVGAGVLGYFSPDVRSFLLMSLIVPPLVALPVLTYAGQVQPILRIPAAILWGVAALAYAGWMLIMALTGVVPAAAVADWERTHDTQKLLDSLSPTSVQQIVTAGIAIAASFIAGILAFLPTARRAAAGWLPLNPNSFVHAVALASVIVVTATSLAPLVVLGEPPALRDIESNATMQQLRDMPSGFVLRLIAYLYFWGIVSITCFVGFPIVRSFRGALVRLGLVIPTVRQVLFAIGAAVLMVGVMTGVDYGIDWLWRQMGWARTDAEALDQMFKFATNLFGAIVIGISAGLSEELFVRGALQPRFGILVSNILFTALHATQYNFDALTSVFLAGIVLGLIRKYSNTTTSAIVHGLYDFIQLYGKSLGWF